MKYNKSGKKGLFIILVASWFLLNLLQAVYTEINPDEAYYFLYGKYLDWGYYDHPPMVALMVRLSSWFFTGNLGVRFMTVVLQIATLILVWLQLDKAAINHRKSVLFFFVIAASLVMFNAYGFITTPDPPLLFFTALFLYGYKKFLDNGDWSFTLLLSLAMAGLLYSKYQGVLIIGFVILSNTRLILNPKFQIALFLAFVLFTPHLYWQYSHGFPSFKYQLIHRSHPFQWHYFVEYLPNQLAVFNPFTMIAVLYVIFKHKPIQQFEKALYFIIIGFLLFFWMTTFRGHAEPQWTVAASIPVIILLNNKITADGWLRNYVPKFIGGSLFLVLTARVLLVTDLLPTKLKIHGKEARYRAIEKIAKNRPVVFGGAHQGSYQNPSLYTFFTGNPATVISTVKTRQTQFDIWHLEQDWHNKPVFIDGVFEGKSKAYKIGNNATEDGFFADRIQTTNQLKIKYKINKDSLKIGDAVSLHFSIENLMQSDMSFTCSDFPVKIHLIMIGKQSLFEVKGTTTKEIEILRSNGEMNNEIKFTVPVLPKGDYKLGLGCNTLFGTTLNSEIKNITLF